MNISDVSVGQRIRLLTTAPSILGARYNDMKLIGKLGFELAVTIADVVTLHNSVYSTLPPGTPVDPKDQDYYVFTNNADGTTKVLAGAWIAEASVESLDNGRLTFVIDGTSTADIERISSMLRGAGFTRITVGVS